MDSPNFPCDTRVNVSSVAGLLLSPVAQKCAGVSAVQLRAERVFILEYHFSTKWSAVVLKSSISACPGKEMPNKTEMFLSPVSLQILLYKLLLKLCTCSSFCIHK
jgi:hypothetical protein